MPAIPRQLGGSFAPPLDENRLAAYRELAEKADPPVAGAMNSLLEMADAYGARPAPAEGEREAVGTPHPSGMGTMFALPQEEIDRLDDVVPWEHEIKMYGELFEGIDAGSDKATRDAAFHLLWLARELSLDRTPLTTDTL